MRREGSKKETPHTIGVQKHEHCSEAADGEEVCGQHQWEREAKPFGPHVDGMDLLHHLCVCVCMCVCDCE